MLLRNVNKDTVAKLAHAALDKQLYKINKFGKSIKVNINLGELFKPKQLPTVFISGKAGTKMVALTKQCPQEIGWHGLVEHETLEDGSEVYTITDIIVYPQDVTGGTTKATDDVGMWYMKQPDEVFNHMRMQGHSHVNYGVTPSAVDVNYYDTLISTVKDYYIFMIVNKKSQYWIELHDMTAGVVYEKADLKVVYETEPVTTWADKQIEQHCILKKPNQPLLNATVNYHYSQVTGQARY